MFLQQLHATVEPLHLFLILLGVSAGRELVWGRRFLPIVLVALLVCLAIWILISEFGVSNGRYFMTAYLAMLPLEALGLLVLLRWIQTRRNFLSNTQSSGYRWAAFALVLVWVVGWADAFIYRESTRKDELALADWMRSSIYSEAHIAIDSGAKRIGYHFQGDMPPVMNSPWDLPNPEANPPQVVIVSRSCVPPEQRDEYLRHLASCNYRIIPVPEFPKSEHLWILVGEGKPPSRVQSAGLDFTPR